MNSSNKIRLIVVGVLAVGCIGLLPAHPGDKYATLTNAQVQTMLDTVKADIQTNYYDPQFHGLDLDKRFNEAREKIAAAKSQDEALLDVSAAMAALKDSH